MSDGLALSLVLAAASAVALNWGLFAQHAQAAGLPRLTVRRPIASLRHLFSNPRWLAGFVVGLGGWGLYVGALVFGPLSLVQATSAGGIGILALLVWRLSGVRLLAREWAGVGLAIAGLALLGVSLAGHGSAVNHLHGSLTGIVAWMLGSAALATLFAGPLRHALAAGSGLGVAAGLLYAAGDVGTKAAVAGGARFAFVPAVLAAHGLAFVLLQMGFQRGGALATAGVATLFTNALPIGAGMAVFHDPLPSGALGAARIIAFTVVVVGAALLTRPQMRRPVLEPVFQGTR